VNVNLMENLFSLLFNFGSIVWFTSLWNGFGKHRHTS
jgi:hypothetical protein